jgi:hypothetical protein
MPNYDLLSYRDFHDTTDDDGPLKIGDSASRLGIFEDLHVVAIGAPIYEGKDATIVLAHSSHPMERFQKLLDRVDPAE